VLFRSYRHSAAVGRQPRGGALEPLRRAARPIQDGDEGESPVVGGKGLRDDPGLPPAGRDVDGAHGVTRLHRTAFHHAHRQHLHSRRPVLDVDRHHGDEEDDQLDLE